MLQRTRFPRQVLTTLTTILAVGACDDTTEPEQESLTEAEVMALIGGLSSTGLNITDPGDRVGQSAACPSGGVTDFSGSTATDSTETTRIIRADIVMVPRACRFQTQTVTFTIDGAPSVRQVGTTTIIGSWESGVGLWQAVEFAYDFTGALDWEMDSPARSGNCSVDLDMSGNIDLPDLESGDTTAVLTGSLSGTACGSRVTIPLDS